MTNKIILICLGVFILLLLFISFFRKRRTIHDIDKELSKVILPIYDLPKPKRRPKKPRISRRVYRFTNDFGKNRSLDIINDKTRDKLTMGKTGPYSGQKWFMVPGKNKSKMIKNMFSGKDKCLTSVGRKVMMKKCRGKRNQQWLFKKKKNGKKKIYNMYLGDKYNLAQVAKNRLRMSKAQNVTGQIWKSQSH